MRPSKTAAYAAAAPTTGRPHAITVFGCTGNAGRAVAYHAAKSAALTRPGTRLALAGRNQAKIEGVLEGIRAELRSEGIPADDMQVEIVIADLSDEKSMLELARSTNVLVACAGPYGRFGEPVVKACVQAGTHYLDITGEWDWVDRMIAEYGAEAEQAGVSLCPFAGYDCVPSELAMELVGSALAMDNDDPCESLRERVGMPLRARHFYLRGQSGGKDWRAALALRTSKPAASGRAPQIDGCKSRQIDAPAPELVAVCIGWIAAAEQVESWYKVLPR